jgi:hypothetical protein
VAAFMPELPAEILDAAALFVAAGFWGLYTQRAPCV